MFVFLFYIYLYLPANAAKYRGEAIRAFGEKSDIFALQNGAENFRFGSGIECCNQDQIRLIAFIFFAAHFCAAFGTAIPVSYTHLDVYKRQVEVILFEDVGEEGMGLAVSNRIIRAAGFDILSV